ncbi:SDR family NAD(P)-dependent oxidoreductase [Moorena bouillonii]|uniref:Oxidoreductase n=1 Tax=Moorena bouillonii PNG TaxID=568701 RepID=A0A1U7N0Z9_9CYAN|nr:SDR family oxidoreductase [Moorena bouillonii]ANM28708.1 hypothetical protein ABI59_02420 [Acidobacteria bacterium Mor1]OLT59616.1 oxidoreductase [Moorena bouillonii PNG]
MATYLIVGASGGIGSALCEMLARDGHRLVLAARREGPLRELADRLDGLPVAMDATDPAAYENAARLAVEQHGSLDGVVNAVGSILLKPAHLTRDEDWAETLSLNLTTAFHAVRSAARTIKGAGSVVLMSSSAARVGLANHEAIAAAKAGVIGLMQSAAASYASRGLRFNALAPGLVRTPLSARITGSPAGEKASLAMHPLGKLGEADQVARFAAWLLDENQDWVTGQVFGVDGGLSTVRTRG